MVNHGGNILINKLTLPKSFQQMIDSSKGPEQKGLSIDKFITDYKPLNYIKKGEKPKLKLMDKTGDIVEVERQGNIVVPPVVKPKKKARGKSKKMSKKLKIEQHTV